MDRDPKIPQLHWGLEGVGDLFSFSPERPASFLFFSVSEPPDLIALTERPTERPPGWTHPGWSAEFPWLVQGTTGRGAGSEVFDLGLFSDASPARSVQASWAALREATGMQRVVHAQQVHGAAVHVQAAGPSGLQICEPADGHVSRAEGVLLTVTVADCVPAFLVAPGTRVVGALHCGWRGVAAGMFEAGLDAMEAEGATRSDVRVHLGPSICGTCYEVGPEVFEALGQPAPPRPTPIDLRSVLAARAARAGVAPGHISVSEHCTRCTASNLFSHRGGDRERQVGYIGLRC